MGMQQIIAKSVENAIHFQKRFKRGEIYTFLFVPVEVEPEYHAHDWPLTSPFVVTGEIRDKFTPGFYDNEWEGVPTISVITPRFTWGNDYPTAWINDYFKGDQAFILYDKEEGVPVAIADNYQDAIEKYVSRWPPRGYRAWADPRLMPRIIGPDGYTVQLPSQYRV
jgi:hypothetical protein